MKRIVYVFMCLTWGMVLVGSATAGVIIWTGGGSGSNWGIAENWNPTGIPPNGSDLVFGVAANYTPNNNRTDLEVNTLSSSGDLGTVTYAFGGNPIVMTGSATISNYYAKNFRFATMGIVLQADLTIDTSKTVEFRGSAALSGAFDLIKDGTGVLQLGSVSAPATHHTGDTYVQGGRLWVTSGNVIASESALIIASGADMEIADGLTIQVSSLTLGGTTYTTPGTWGSVSSSADNKSSFFRDKVGSGGVIEVIPEPATLGMLGLGALVALLIRRQSVR